MRSRSSRRTGRLAVPIVVPALVAAAISLAASGCGAGANAPGVASLGGAASTVPRAASTASTSSDARTAALVRFAACMNRRGFRTVVGRGGRGVSILGTFDQSSLSFVSAQRACEKLLPGGTPSASTVSERRRHFLAVAECMRRHGFPGFPNPNGQGQLLIGPNEGLDADSPRFEQALQACGGA
jgi:hypothetical protein